VVFGAVGCVLLLVPRPAFTQRPELPETPEAQPGPEASVIAIAPPPWLEFSLLDRQRPQENTGSEPPRWWTLLSVERQAALPTKSAGPYLWRGLIWQTAEFNVIENGFRVSADNVMRDTLAHRPFWHNYAASMGQLNMRRWNDGDTFIVNYIGHALHGSVAAMIEIQNSPTDRRLEWGDPGYAKSRFKGFLWATVFSTHSELSPAGEPGVGNQGGFTYGKNCLYKCYEWPADNGSAGAKYTNDTGWVDFIATPTVGMAWVVTEDVLDKYISDALVRKHPDRFWPLVVRGGLNPSRSFANILRWRQPWYRDYEQPVNEPARVFWYPAEDELEYHAIPRLQLAPYWSRFTIAANTPACFNCRETAIGGGLQTTVKLRGWLGLDTSFSVHPGASPLPSDRAGGGMITLFSGLSATKQWRYYAVHFAMRPGMVRWSSAYLTSPVLYPVTTWPPRIATHGGDADGMPVPGVVDANGTAQQPALGAIHHFAWDWNLALDYRFTQRVGFRVGLEDAVVRYRTDKVDAPGIGTAPYLSWLSKEQYLNRGNFVLQVGPVFSF
jgi:hypothetical protein